jgi:hypothetical protein
MDLKEKIKTIAEKNLEEKSEQPIEWKKALVIMKPFWRITPN